MTTALITPVIPAEDTEMVETIFKGIEEHLGFIPDGLRLYSISPPVLQAFVTNVGYFMAHPTLSQELLATIRYLVSSNAGCTFCIDFNAAILANLGKSTEELAAAQEDTDNAPVTDAEKVLLNIALASLDNPEGIKQEDIQKGLDHGFSERDIFDVVVTAASNKAFTHVLRTFKVEHQGTFA